MVVSTSSSNDAGEPRIRRDVDADSIGTRLPTHVGVLAALRELGVLILGQSAHPSASKPSREPRRSRHFLRSFQAFSPTVPALESDLHYVIPPAQHVVEARVGRAGARAALRYRGPAIGARDLRAPVEQIIDPNRSL